MDASEKFLLYIIDVFSKNKVKVNVAWYGWFMASVGCFRPETVKMVLKGQ